MWIANIVLCCKNAQNSFICARKLINAKITDKTFYYAYAISFQKSLCANRVLVWALLYHTTRVTRCVGEKKRPKYSPTHFCQNLFIIFSTHLKIWASRAILIKTTQSKQWSKRRKFAQSGHPAYNSRDHRNQSYIDGFRSDGNISQEQKKNIRATRKNPGRDRFYESTIPAENFSDKFSSPNFG
jgi:hypothetical protein